MNPQAEAIKQLATACEAQLSSGAIQSMEEFLSQHSELREELAGELKKRQMIAAAIEIGRETDEVSTVAPRETLAYDATSAPGQVLEVACPECRRLVRLQEGASFGPIECESCHEEFTVVTDDAADTETGRTVGNFQLESLLGRGGFGAVWRAYDTKLDRHVAIKLPRRGELSETEADQFIREARAAAQLSHPNIVRVLEVGQTDEAPYIACDLIEGQTLSEALETGPLPIKQAVDICRTVAEALESAHAAGVVHRDLKPSNILLNKEGTPFVADFGLAKRSTGEVTITADGQLLGTPAYMPPEQASGRSHEADARSDVYSLGALFYHMLTGETCFRGTVQALIHQALYADPARPRVLNRHIPADLETICLKCLEKAPEHRYPTSGELAADLSRWQRKEPIVARPLGPMGRVLRWRARKPTVATLAGLLVVAVVGGFCGVAWKWRDAELALTEKTRAETRANSNLASADKVVDDFLTTVANDTLLNEPQMVHLRSKLLGMGKSYLERLAQENASDLNSLIRAALASGRQALLRVDMGETKSLDPLDAAITSLQALDASQEDRALVHRALFDLYVMKGDACLELDHAQFSSSAPLECYLQAKDHFERAGIDLTTAEGMREHAALQSIVAVGYGKARRPEAERELLKAVELWQAVIDQDPADVNAMFRLSSRHGELAARYDRELNFVRAQQHHQQAIQLARRVVEVDSIPNHRNRLATALKMSVLNLNSTVETQQAVATLREVVTIRKQLTHDFPTIDRYQLVLVDDLLTLGSTQIEIDELSDAREQLDLILQIVDQNGQQDPDNLSWQAYRANALLLRGRTYFQDNQLELAAQAFKESSIAAESICNSAAELTVDPWILHSSAQRYLGRIFAQREKMLPASDCHQRAIEIIETALHRHPSVKYQRELLVARIEFATSFVDDHPEQVQRQAELGLQDLAALRAQTSGDFTFGDTCQATLEYFLGRSLLRQGKGESAAQQLETAMTLSLEHLRKTPHFEAVYVIGARYAAEAQMGLGNPSQAIDYADQTLLAFDNTPEALQHGVRVLDQCLQVITRDQLLGEEERATFVETQTARAVKWFTESMEQGCDISQSANNEKYLPYLRAHSAEVARWVKAAQSQN